VKWGGVGGRWVNNLIIPGCQGAGGDSRSVRCDSRCQACSSDAWPLLWRETRTRHPGRRPSFPASKIARFRAVPMMLNPGDWFCIFVRCDQPRSPLTLHFSTPGPDIHGDIKLVIDEDTFAVSVPASLKSSLPLSTRAQALPDALIEAMKAGSAISVQGSHLQSPYNRISLQNSRKAIERIDWACARPYPSAARFWRRLTRSLRFF